MEWLLVFVIQPLVSGVVKRLPDLIIDQIKNRSKPDRRSQLDQARPDQRPPTDVPVTSDPLQIARVVLYPEIFASEYSSSQTTHLVKEVLENVPGLHHYAVLAPGFGVYGGFSGEGGRPSIAIRTELHAGSIDVYAHLNAMFPTADAKPAFDIKVARFGWGPEGSQPGSGTLGSWEYVNLSELLLPDEQIVAGVIVWFLLNCVEIYWRDKAGVSVDLLPGLLQQLQAIDGRIESADRVAAEAMEIQELGFEVEAVRAADGTSQLIAIKGPLTVGFLLAPEYPGQPPVVVYERDAEQVHLEIDSLSWSPSCRLAHIAKGLPA